MALPLLLKDNLTDLSMPTGGNVATSDYISNFTMQAQDVTQWCWAAVSSSTSFFFNSSSPWTQCKIVDKNFSRNDCCSNKDSSGCNIAYRLDLGLTTTGNYSNAKPGSLTLLDLKDEIKNKRPMHVFLSGGAGHFVAITGYSTNSNKETRYRVQDPANGTSDVLFEDLRDGNYDGHGGMAWFYFTKS